MQAYECEKHLDLQALLAYVVILLFLGRCIALQYNALLGTRFTQRHKTDLRPLATPALWFRLEVASVHHSLDGQQDSLNGFGAAGLGWMRPELNLASARAAESWCLHCTDDMPNAGQLQGLLSWMSDKGITWDPEKVNVHGGNYGAAPFAVHAVRDVEESETLCEIPKSAVLSVRNTAIADLIEHEQLGGGLGLILAIMFEYSIAKRSEWYGTVHSISLQPQRKLRC